MTINNLDLKEEVSILMNCYNGEKFLKESIESVFKQSHTNWKIFFVDNCSEDASEEIAKSFGPKIHYLRTKKNVSLAEARAFGIRECKGKYLMFLDVDDRYQPNTIKILLNEIKNSDYLAVYAGHKNIDINGKYIGSYNPKPKSGYIFDKLLVQWDIPTASLIMNLESYKKLDVRYDKNIIISSEYDHFLRLATNNKFKCIPGEIIDYRIHHGGLTYEKQSYAYKDRINTLKKIIKNDPSLLKKYPKEFNEAFARADYYLSRTFYLKGEIVNARRVIRKHIFLSKEYLAVYVIFFLPKSIRDYIFKIKYSL